MYEAVFTPLTDPLCFDFSVITRLLRCELIAHAWDPSETTLPIRKQKISERIVRDWLSERFGMPNEDASNLAVIRRCFEQLSLEGLLVIAARKGTTVRAVTDTEKSEYVAFRYGVECEAALRLHKLARDNPREAKKLRMELQAPVDSMASHIERVRQLRFVDAGCRLLFIEQDLRFHTRICELAKCHDNARELKLRYIKFASLQMPIFDGDSEAQFNATVDHLDSICTEHAAYLNAIFQGTAASTVDPSLSCGEDLTRMEIGVVNRVFVHLRNSYRRWHPGGTESNIPMPWQLHFLVQSQSQASQPPKDNVLSEAEAVEPSTELV